MRNYVRKTNRGNWNEDQMKTAIECVKRKEMSIRKAASSFNVPLESLRRRCNGQLKQLSGENMHKKQLRPIRTVLTEEQETDLESYILALDNSFYGLSINELRRVIYEYCERNKIKHPFNKVHQMAGRDFVSGFLKRRQTLSLRKPEAVSLNRVFGLNKTSIDRYFENLKTVLEKFNIRPHRIFNVDESGLTCVHKPIKVLAPKGKRVVATATSGERGVTTTIVVCCSATGSYVPPMMIFKRKRKRQDLTEGAPVGTLNEVSDSGWINTELFMTYLKHFAEHTKPTKDDRVLLILDGHRSHTKNIGLIDFARDNGIEIVSLPPHTSHKLQPLDRTFFKPLKVAFNAACTSWMRLHPARRITIDKIGALFNTAYLKAATIENAISGFRCTGIFPYDASILPEKEFLSDPREPLATPDVSSITEEPIASSSQAGSSVDAIDMIVHSTPVSFREILKVPDIVEKKKTKRSEESEIITGSPYKLSLEKSETETKKLSKAKKETLKKKKTTKTKTIPPVVEDCECLFCGDWWHESLPGENWIQCIKCSVWLHELCCSSDKPICDFCD
ncbi:uncharacterized protein LOC130649317 [Hydractinia symbiolongicarpus]|uniref:uncharacterized protein LOC130649317 n=1 Tax=Hydractinia symbiolongicarpus TaxID=13093 RepID=UPI00254A7C54|nr:uncharacterized protein LOC130649317 [Hydractinia symbiolongicarpus]